MTKKQKKMLYRIIISAVLMIAFKFVPVDGIVRFLLYLIPYLVIGYDILLKAWKGIKHKQVFDENFLMAIATIGAMIVGLVQSGDYVEGIAVMLFYQIGELFQSYAVGKSRKNISEPGGKRVQGDHPAGAECQLLRQGLRLRHGLCRSADCHCRNRRRLSYPVYDQPSQGRIPEAV